MTSYSLEKEGKEKKLRKKEILDQGLSMKPRLKKRNDFVEVKEIVIVCPTLQEKVLKMQFHLAFRRLLKLVIEITEDDSATSGDVSVAMSEIERMKAILKDKYQKVFSFEEYQSMWKKAMYLEQELQKKLILIQNFEKIFLNQMTNMPALEEERGRGR